jgi:hypothetical protein
MNSVSGFKLGLSGSAAAVSGIAVARCRRAGCRVHVVGRQLANGRLLLHVGEADLLAGDGVVEPVEGFLLTFGPLEEALFNSRQQVVIIFPQAPPAISRWFQGSSGMKKVMALPESE